MATGTVTQAELRRRTVEVMEEDLRVKPGQAKDFVDSLISVIEEALADGNKVSVFGICVLNPGFRLARPKRKGVNPRTGEEATLKATPNKTTLRASVAKRMKEALPSPSSKAGQALKAEAEGRAAKAAERAAEREREAEKEERRQKRAAKK